MNKEKLEQEELRILSDSGYDFELEINRQNNRDFLLNLILKPSFIKIKKTYHIEPLRLSTMDRIAKYQLDLYLNEEAFKDESNMLVEMNSIVVRNLKPLTKIIALAVLGTSYKKSKFNKLYKELLDGLTPNKVYELIGVIQQLSSSVNFINSTRLAKAQITIKPNEVE